MRGPERGLGQGRARIARGLTMSAACLLFPSSAHVAAGGAVPSHPGLLLVAALLGTACVGLADRRRSPGEIAAVLLLSQPILHVVLAMAGHPAPGADPSGAVTPTPAMLLAHLIAAGVLTVLLAGAEAVAWSMAALAATTLITRAHELLRVPSAAVAKPVGAGTLVDLRVPPAVHLVRSNPWRGPPASA